MKVTIVGFIERVRTVRLFRKQNQWLENFTQQS